MLSSVCLFARMIAPKQMSAKCLNLVQAFTSKCPNAAMVLGSKVQGHNGNFCIFIRHMTQCGMVPVWDKMITEVKGHGGGISRTGANG